MWWLGHKSNAKKINISVLASQYLELGRGANSVAPTSYPHRVLEWQKLHHHLKKNLQPGTRRLFLHWQWAMSSIRVTTTWKKTQGSYYFTMQIEWQTNSCLDLYCIAWHSNVLNKSDYNMEDNTRQLLYNANWMAN